MHYGGEALAATLVSDDQTCLESGGGMLHVSPPPAIAGRLEVRGLGIVPVAWTPRARLVLVADIAPPETITRHPEPATTDIVGVSVPLLRIAAFEPSAPAKLLLALARLR